MHLPGIFLRYMNKKQISGHTIHSEVKRVDDLRIVFEHLGRLWSDAITSYFSNNEAIDYFISKLYLLLCHEMGYEIFVPSA